MFKLQKPENAKVFYELLKISSFLFMFDFDGQVLQVMATFSIICETWQS